MDKYIKKLVETNNLNVSPGADEVSILSHIWKPGTDLDVYQNTVKGGNVAFTFGVRMDQENMIAEAKLFFYRKNRSGYSTIAYACNQNDFKEVITMPEFSCLHNKPVKALLEFVESFNEKQLSVHKKDGGFTLKI